MSLSNEQIQMVEHTLKKSLRNKFQNYHPETSAMPFHTRLLGKDRMALFSFIHSLNTTFGVSIYEPVAQALGASKYNVSALQTKVEGFISSEAQRVIQDIIDRLTTGELKPNKAEEIQAIREVSQKGEMKKVKPTRVDIRLESSTGAIYLIDIKTAKPNIGEFKGFKRTLLEWVACTLAAHPEAEVHSLIAIPYNPYFPEPYARWTMAGLFDLSKEVKVAEEFWDFLGGNDTYNSLLDCFERVGVELRPEIDSYFDKFNR